MDDVKPGRHISLIPFPPIAWAAAGPSQRFHATVSNIPLADLTSLPLGLIKEQYGGTLQELMAEEAANRKDIEDMIEEERAKVDAKTAITQDVFLNWRQKNRDQKAKAREDSETERKRKGVMTGREIFAQANPFLVLHILKRKHFPRMFIITEGRAAWGEDVLLGVLLSFIRASCLAVNEHTVLKRLHISIMNRCTDGASRQPNLERSPVAESSCLTSRPGMVSRKTSLRASLANNDWCVNSPAS